MKKKPSYTLNNQKPLKTHGDVNGPITSYTMNPVDLGEWRSKLPPVPDYAKEKLLNRSMMGGDIA